MDEVTCNGRRIASEAVDYLVSKSYRDIGYAGDCANEARFDGYLDALNRHGISVDPLYIYSVRPSEQAGFELMHSIIAQGDTPEAIYCANDIIAVGMIKCLTLNRYRGRKIAIIASDDIEQAQEITPMLTTIALPKSDMGRFAVQILLDRIDGGHSAVASMELATRLMVRESA